jgi:hypothetical protein
MIRELIYYIYIHIVCKEFCNQVIDVLISYVPKYINITFLFFYFFGKQKIHIGKLKRKLHFLWKN